MQEGVFRVQGNESRRAELQAAMNTGAPIDWAGAGGPGISLSSNDNLVVAQLVKGLIRDSEEVGPARNLLAHTQAHINRELITFLSRQPLVIPTKAYDAIIDAGKGADSAVEMPRALTSVVKRSFSPEDKTASTTLFSFLKEIAQNSEQTKMTPGNLAVCFAPTVLRAPQPDPMVRERHSFLCACTFFRASPFATAHPF